MKLLALLLAASSLGGCANMTPEQRAEFGRNLAIGMAVGASAGLAARAAQPVYIAPVPVYVPPAPRFTTCNRYGNQVMCNSY